VALQLGVTELRLTRVFDPSSLLPLGEVLKTDTTLTHLDLSQVRLEDSAAYVVRAPPATPANRLSHGSLTHCLAPAATRWVRSHCASARTPSSA
jgi:hypothetical protein